MSLLKIRKERRELGHRYKRPPSLVRLIVILMIVLGVIWWLGRF